MILIGGVNVARTTFSFVDVVLVNLVFQTVPPHKFCRLENREHEEVYGAHAGKGYKLSSKRKQIDKQTDGRIQKNLEIR